MALTPIEIRQQKFRRSFHGYHQQEVNNYLARIVEDYEELYQENAELKERLQKSEFQLAKYRNLEETLNQSLVVAQKTGEEVKANARQEAELMLQEARGRIGEIFVINEDIIKRLNVFKTEMKYYLSAQIEMMDKNERRIEDIVEFFYSRDMKEILEKLTEVEKKGLKSVKVLEKSRGSGFRLGFWRSSRNEIGKCRGIKSKAHSSSGGR